MQPLHISVYLARLPDFTVSPVRTPATTNRMLAADGLWRTLLFRLVTADDGGVKKC